MAKKKTKDEKLSTAAATSAWVGNAYKGTMNTLANARTTERQRVNAHFAKVYANKSGAAQVTQKKPTQPTRSQEASQRRSRIIKSTAPQGIQSGLQSLQDALNPPKKKKER